MCYWTAAAQTGLQAFSMFSGNTASAKMAEAQASGSLMQMNYAFQNYEEERRDSYDAAVNDIIKTRLNALQLNSQVNAAVAEGMAGGGRTADRIMRAAQADTDRKVSSIQENYQQKSNEVDLNKESTLLSTKDYISNLKAQTKPNKWADLLSLGATAVSSYSSAKTMKAQAKADGMDFGFWSGTKMKTPSFKKLSSVSDSSMGPYSAIRLRGIG